MPRSLIHNWQEEAKRFVPSLRVIDHTGPIETVDDLIEWVNTSEGKGLGLAQRKG